MKRWADNTHLLGKPKENSKKIDGKDSRQYAFIKNGRGVFDVKDGGKKLGKRWAAIRIY